eukprot:Nk52_evm1s2349 gene=Nk52_evmTU1s2349
MKITRRKNAQRILNYYKQNFGLHEPYQVVMDGTFCAAALNSQILLADQIPKYLNGKCQLMTTRCCFDEVKKLGTEFYGAYKVCKQFKFQYCGHFANQAPKNQQNQQKAKSAKGNNNNNNNDNQVLLKTGFDCLKELIGYENKYRLIIATQDKKLRRELRKIPNVPLMYIDYNAILLEPPSDASREKVQDRLQVKLAVSGAEKERLVRLEKRRELERRLKKEAASALESLDNEKESEKGKEENMDGKGEEVTTGDDDEEEEGERKKRKAMAALEARVRATMEAEERERLAKEKEAEEERLRKLKRKRNKQPNPLSCKKKKKKTTVAANPMQKQKESEKEGQMGMTEKSGDADNVQAQVATDKITNTDDNNNRVMKEEEMLQESESQSGEQMERSEAAKDKKKKNRRLRKKKGSAAPSDASTSVTAAA